MKKHLILFLLTIISLKGYSQVNYEKGYFIGNDDNRVEVLIKNLDWLNNPKEFQYKTGDNSDVQKISINSVKEFGIYDVSKYIRKTVSVEKSSDNTGSLSTSKEPEFKEETVLLKTLVLGKANLFMYREKGKEIFFYNIENSKIEPLIFKRYKVNGNNIAKNEAYKQQLFTNLKCQNISYSDVEKVNYGVKELSNFFTKYNLCENSLLADFNKSKKQQLFHLNIRPGINYNSYDLKYGDKNNYRDFDKSSEIGYRIGVEAEFILNFNRNKWAFFIEPSYQQFGYSKTIYNQEMTLDYKSLDLPMGIRYYVFLDNLSSKLFLNISYAPQLTFDSKITYESVDDLEIAGSSSFAAGLGYKFKNKYIAEVRYGFEREIMELDLPWYSSLNTVSIILGYTIF